jgi:hypothetical protein
MSAVGIMGKGSRGPGKAGREGVQSLQSPSLRIHGEGQWSSWGRTSQGQG